MLGFTRNIRSRFWQRNNSPGNAREFPLKVIWVTPYVIQIFLAVGLTGYLSLRSSQKAVSLIANRLTEEVGKKVERHIDRYMDLPRLLNQINYDAVKLGAWPSKDTEALGEYLVKQVKASKVSYMIYAEPSGLFVAAGHFFGDERITIDEINKQRYRNHHLYIHTTNEAGQRTDMAHNAGNMLVDGELILHQESWFSAAIEQKGPTWTPVYNWAVEPYPLAIATSRPIYGPDDELAGVIAVEQKLSQMDEFLQQINVSPSGQIYILERSGKLIASSHPAQKLANEGNKPQRTAATQSHNRLVQVSAEFLEQKFNAFETIQARNQLTFSHNGEQHYLQVSPWKNKHGLDWLVVIVMPKSDFMSQINENRQTTIYLCFGALLIAMVVGYYTSRWIAKPILELSQMSQAIAAGDLEQTVSLRWIREVRQLEKSFNLMAQKLQSSFVELQTANRDLAHQTHQLSAINKTLEQEIFEREQAEAQLKHTALYDSLTGCPNRAHLMENLNIALQKMHGNEAEKFAILFLDIDRFKVVNDSLGHQVGDQLLIALVHQLKSVLREEDLISRLGGDEFVILLNSVTNLQDATQVANRIHELMQSPLMLDDRLVYATVSIGIVFSSSTYHEGDELLRDADIALYRAKEKGKARSEVFDGEMYTEALERHHLEHDLRVALAQEDLQIYYQPIVDINQQTTIGFEALSRWSHPEKGWISPGQFIPIAEETGIIVPLGEWILRSACQQLADWQQDYPHLGPLSMSVNLSAVQLQHPDLLKTIDEILVQTGLEGQQLYLELTESMLMENVEELIDLLHQIRTRGIQLSIDDFGTGYSSLSYLHRYPINKLKIDRSFVNPIRSGENSHDIIKTIISLGHQLKIDIIAEGVETQIQLEFLRKCGCQQAQGYFFSRPLPANEALQTLLDSNSNQEYLLNS